MDQNNMPLYEKLLEHKHKKTISFHVPGHKNGRLMEDIDLDFAKMLEFDVTELSGLDDLHDPHGAIDEAQQLLTHLYGSKKSYFLVNGSTVGNLAMILAVCSEGDTVLVERNCHKSILHGLMLANVNPIFISPEIEGRLGLPSGISAATVKEAFKRYPNIKACIFTYPNYYGHTFDLKTIIETAHLHHSIVLIDEAHGPHLQLGKPFPPSALKLGADIIVHSAHKILPAMTMGSFLHINSKNISSEKVEFYLSILQSSSPSYPIMVSLDMARNFLANFTDEDIIYTMRKRDRFIEQIEGMAGLQIGEIKKGQDPLKLSLRHELLTGYELQTELEKVAVYPELADVYQVLLLLPLLKSGMKFPYELVLEKLRSLQLIKSDVSPSPSININQEKDQLSQLALTYKEMSSLSYQWVDAKHAVGRIAAKMIIPYPPGIPLFLPGEKITNEHIGHLNFLLQANARFQGEVDELKAGRIAVFT